MSLLIGALAFPDQELLARAKFGILAGSLFAGIAGSLILLRGGRDGADPDLQSKHEEPV